MFAKYKIDERYRLKYHFYYNFLIIVLLFAGQTRAQTGNITKIYKQAANQSSWIIETSNKFRIKLTAYGSSVIRVQAVRKSEEFLKDNHYGIIQTAGWKKSRFIYQDKKDFAAFKISAQPGSVGIEIIIKKNPIQIQFNVDDTCLLKEKDGIEWNGNIISESFEPDEQEHFTGLGHGFFGKAETIDLKGQQIGRNYGTAHGDQAPLIVPFYMSSRGYGIFLNSMFTNQFTFNNNNKYGFSIDDYGDANGRMDYFFIYGPEFKTILDHYTKLTGRPRLPQLAFFGLGLSDKGNDETTKDPSDENWWKRKVEEQRNTGISIDHLINDNRWRAGGGKRCESYFEWDKSRFPDPAEYERWIKKNGLILTIDYNRCISSASEGWVNSFNVPHAEKVDHGESTPDFTRKDVRDWFWNLFWKKSLNPSLHYPGNALWIDEFDELGPIADTVKLGNNKVWGEIKNYWFFLIAKALVEDGWDKSSLKNTRPFVWVRGMTAGAQRYATLWTGDIQPGYEAMKNQIISMQLAGLSGFPFEGHDAGGFYNWETKKGPDAELYRKWSMAFGSFTPFWKPHGMGESRWPLDRTPKEIETAKIFTNLRYQLMPYTYSAAHECYEYGTPLAKAMVMDYQSEADAWIYDLQYMWGSQILVVPNPSQDDSVKFWVPPGEWYDYWTNEKIYGGAILTYPSPDGGLILLIKAGSIIPMAIPALSTAFINKGKMILNIYPGKDGEFNLYEDDGITEKYKAGENRKTLIKFDNRDKILTIGKANGRFTNAPTKKDYTIFFHNITDICNVKYNGAELGKTTMQADFDKLPNGFYFDSRNKLLQVKLSMVSVNKKTDIRLYH
jgi:alpha-D-xyloside xylohydrolase